MHSPMRTPRLSHHVYSSRWTTHRERRRDQESMVIRLLEICGRFITVRSGPKLTRPFPPPTGQWVWAERSGRLLDAGPVIRSRPPKQEPPSSVIAGRLAVRLTFGVKPEAAVLASVNGASRATHSVFGGAYTMSYPGGLRVPVIAVRNGCTRIDAGYYQATFKSDT